MKHTVTIDRFFEDQPDFLFVEDLKKPYHQKPIPAFAKRKPEKDEVCVDGLYIKSEFSDEEGLLETAYDDFKLFCEVYDIGGKSFPVIIRKVITGAFEEFFVEVTDEAIIISANDTEGIRRGVYFLEDEIISSEAPVLKKGKTHKVPYIRKRITRGFFSPTNRPPKNGDELSDDIDYYPEGYLNRLAHDGTNGLWIYTRFSDIIPSNIVTEFGEGYEKRIAKLNSVCDRCARYGIGVYVFAIEPMSPKGELRVKYDALLGGAPDLKDRPLCTHTELGKKYCIDATKQLCKLVPRLAGLLSLTAGERLTSCGGGGIRCPHCGEISKGTSLAQTIDCIQEGIRQSGRTDVEFISWTYGHRRWTYDEISDYVKDAPDDVMLMQNFDDMGYEEQLGKTRIAVDYWLSYVGPSAMFNHTATEANRYGKHLYAKMQICCSHEIATLPYIPSPAHIFEKYKEARKFNVEGIMECWYFGNYPSIMSKAAGELSFYNDFSEKDAFLYRLASLYAGRTNARKLVEAWKHFEEGYKNYPLNIMFSYYGPMHDGVCWDLCLKPRNFAPARTWQLTDEPNGDRIYDALILGHTLEEAIILVEKMRNEFREGVKILEDAVIPEEHRSVINALTILSESGANILNFYKKREQLGFGEADAKLLLAEMKELVKDEMRLSLEMCKLCENDNRLGYHSEAEGFKFFPKKLLDRVEKLKNLLATEFPEVEGRVENGLIPLEYYAGVEDDVPHYKMMYGDISRGIWQTIGTPTWQAVSNETVHAKFCATYDDENFYFKFAGSDYARLSPEFTLMHPYSSFLISNTSAEFVNEAQFYHGVYGKIAEKELEKFKFERCEDGILMTAKRSDIGWTETRPMKMGIIIGGCAWTFEPNAVRTLGKISLASCDYGWFMPEKE